MHIKKNTDYLKKDFPGGLFHIFEILYDKVYQIIFVPFVYFQCYVKGIKIKAGCTFYGIPKFVRFPISYIEVGNNCSFRSGHSSNLIGINHKCIIATHQVGAKIIIGDYCGFSGTVIGAAKEIIIGKHVICGANTVITDFDWHTDRYSSEPKPIHIKDNVWLGLNTVVLKGVAIGENTIIGANSLVTKDIPANVIAAGNPCRVIKKIR
jgi:acetyltransferase-like isoleucine patch superfamily enzyme